MITDTELERIERLGKHAREMSDALIRVRPLGGSELFVRIGDEFYADPKYCGEAITQTKAELHEARKTTAIAERRAEAAEAENERLRKALEPFVKEFEERREAYIRRYPRHPAVGAANFDEMPDHWPMESSTFTMGTFRAARLALENTNG